MKKTHIILFSTILICSATTLIFTCETIFKRYMERTFSLLITNNKLTTLVIISCYHKSSLLRANWCCHRFAIEFEFTWVFDKHNAVSIILSRVCQN